MPHNCEKCAFRARAEARPGSFLARLWRWHTRWCPGWKAYQKSLAAPNTPPLELARDSAPIAAGKSSYDMVDVALAFDLIGLAPDTVMVDMGCGRGHYALAAAERIDARGMIHAADLWREGVLALDVTASARQLDQIDPLVVDISKSIPLESGTIDVCFFATVIHDLVADGTAEGALSEARRLLKPQGTLAVIEFKKTPGPPGPPESIRLSETELDALLSPFGFARRRSSAVGEHHYLSLYGIQAAP